MKPFSRLAFFTAFSMASSWLCWTSASSCFNWCSILLFECHTSSSMMHSGSLEAAAGREVDSRFSLLNIPLALKSTKTEELTRAQTMPQFSVRCLSETLPLHHFETYEMTPCGATPIKNLPVLLVLVIRILLGSCVQVTWTFTEYFKTIYYTHTFTEVLFKTCGIIFSICPRAGHWINGFKWTNMTLIHFLQFLDTHSKFVCYVLVRNIDAKLH